MQAERFLRPVCAFPRVYPLQIPERSPPPIPRSDPTDMNSFSFRRLRRSCVKSASSRRCGEMADATDLKSIVRLLTNCSPLAHRRTVATKSDHWTLRTSTVRQWTRRRLETLARKHSESVLDLLGNGKARSQRLRGRMPPLALVGTRARTRGTRASI